ncbi:hypothetical protein [Rhodoplanes sp. Z2-YC6860]|uniref:hypothetical protein n=1 Tax=Rhodoplanes sp. Z2-YC6860 TaxID=674703 RepID=UPI000831676D|nr:hypothetical protein [Rhodoplanes sp. Z2-YC6860]
MRVIGPNLVKAELFLIVLAALCLVGAAIALIAQHSEPTSTTAEEREPVSRPLPAGPRTFQP